jgi:hypothetical protein
MEDGKWKDKAWFLTSGSLVQKLHFGTLCVAKLSFITTNRGAKALAPTALPSAEIR